MHVEMQLVKILYKIYACQIISNQLTGANVTLYAVEEAGKQWK